MRPIDADALIEILAEMQGRCATKAALVQNSKIWQQVKAMSTVEAEPVRHAYWIKKMTVKLCAGFDVYEPHWYCSNCKEKYEPSFAQICKYCYVCGAKMDEERKEE